MQPPIPDESARVAPFERFAALVVWALAAVHLAIVVVFTWRAWIPIPFSDDFDWMIAAADAPANLLAYAFTPHNNQLIAWSRLLELADVRFFTGRSVASTTAALAFAVAVAAFIAAAVFKAVRPGPAGWAAAALVFLALTEATLVSDTGWRINAAYVFAAGFAALAIAAFEHAGDAPRTTRWAPIAVLFALLAMVSQGAGLAVWPVLAISAGRRRLKHPLVLASLAAGLALLALEVALVGRSAGAGSDPFLLDPGHIRKMALYALGFVGLPWTGGAPLDLGDALFGLVVLVASAWTLMRRLGDDPESRVARIGQGLVLYGVGLAAMATLQRVDELAAPVVPVRYAVLIGLLHAGLAMQLPPLLRRVHDRSRVAMWTLAVLVAAAAVQWQWIAANRALNDTRAILAASAAFDRGDRSPAVLGLVYPDAARAEALRAELRRRGLF